jgi:tetratricopeptide (TPR) repeat protein
MSSIKEIKRQLDATAHAIETLDRELSAGRLSADEHARLRAEREGEAGRLYLILRQTQRDTHRETPRPEPPATAIAPPAWWRRPAALAPAAVVVLVAGAGGGVVLTRRYSEPPRPAVISSAPFALPPGVGSPATDGSPAAVMGQIEVQALRLATTRDDAPIPSILRLAHVDLDAGRLDMARALYARVLAREPQNAEAITHQGSILYQEGRIDEALAKVDAALRIDPTYIHAHWDRVQYLFHGKRDFAAAIKAGDAFLKVVPDGPDADNVRRLIADAHQQTDSKR